MSDRVTALYATPDDVTRWKTLAAKDAAKPEGTLHRVILALIERIEALESFARDVATGYDHDEDAHKYGTPCRECRAKALIGDTP